MSRGVIHSKVCSKSNTIKDWYCEKTKDLSFPIYSSYDIRDSGFKVSNVDANIFPAGFNNICPTDKESAVEIMRKYVRNHYGTSVKKVLLVTEEHTNNPFYWENVLTIQSLLEQSGHQVLVAFPKNFEGRVSVKSATGKDVQVVSGYENSPAVKDFKPDLIISNNDFSDANHEWAETVTLPMNPPRELGWYQRKKSLYFKMYNQLVGEFSNLVGFDPFLLNVRTQVFENFDMADLGSKEKLAMAVDQMIRELKAEYAKRGIEQEPFVFVKNNSGTYGLAVVRVGSGQEVLNWNNRSRTKMKAAKGGRDVEEVIIQEGISSVVKSESATAEPVIYMIGCELAGGFLRTHAEKGSTDSLNSPGAVYKKLCVSDLTKSLEGHPLENVYGWSAKLGMLAIGLEAREMGVEFKGFLSSPCQ
jgi:glutamate--cysteine ligase